MGAEMVEEGRKGAELAQTLYDVMEMAPRASFEELHRAYRRRAKVLHPDRLAAVGGAGYEQAVRAMQELNEAWHVLRDSTRRHGYDRSLGLGADGPLIARDRGRRSVSFPFHRSLGEVFIRPEHLRQTGLAREGEAGWCRVSSARASVWVPPGHDAKLVVAPGASSELASLADLRPGDLQALDLSAVEATDADLHHLTGLVGLLVLDLGGARIGERGLARLAGLPDLTELSLAGTGLADADLAHLAPLSHLRNLDLSGTRVEGSGLGHLRALPSLRRLSLAGTALTDAWMPQLLGLRLRHLDLSGTKVAFENVLRLKSSMPGCVVLRGR